MDLHENILWYHSKVEKEALRKLTERSNLEGFIQTLSYLGIVAMLGGGTYYAFNKLPLWISLPVFYIYITIFSEMPAAIHELTHKTVFKSKFWNEIFIVLFSFLSWWDFVYFQASHMRHHQYTVHEKLDLEVVLPLKVTWLDWIFVFTINLKKVKNDMIPIFRRSLGIVRGEWEERIFPESKKTERRKLFWWSRVFILGHIVLAGIFILTGQWILLLMITFAAFFGNWLNFICGFTQHAGMKPNVNDFRLCCRTLKINPILAYLYWQMNYHVEHHMYAGVPFHNLKKLRRLIAEDLPEAKALIPAWKDILSAQRKQKKNLITSI